MTQYTNVGFESNITRTEFGGAPFTPAGPTAGSSEASEWLFARATAVGATPTTGTDYFGFTVTPDGDNVLRPRTLTFDATNRANDAGGIITGFEVFASIDGGPFESFGFSSIVAPASLNTFLNPPATQVIDLTDIRANDSLELRIALSDNSNLNSKGSWIQGIQLRGFAAPVPEPASLTLVGLAGLALVRRRRGG